VGCLAGEVALQSELDRQDAAWAETRLSLATEAAQLGIWDWDLATNAFVYSPIARAICGFAGDGEITFDDVVAVTHPDDYPRTSAQSRRALDPNIRDETPYEYRIIRRDGEVRWVVAHGRAVFAESAGEIRPTRYVGTLQDITERRRLEEAERSYARRQRQIEAELAEREALLRTVFDAAELFIAVVELTEESFIYVLSNKATADYYGFQSDRTDVDARELALDRDVITAWRASMLEIWQSGAPRTMEYQFGRAGEIPSWYLGTYAPLPTGASGRPRMSFVVIDITTRKVADEQQRLLMREVDHRAKNALAVVQAVVNLTKEEEPTAFKTAVQGRVAAIARAHGLLAADRWAGVDLHRLLQDELAPYATDRIRLNGPTFVLPASLAQSMALIVHELATNAAKYGALSTTDGSLNVEWRSDAAKTLEFTWRERCGVGVVPRAPARQGFGLTLLDRTITQIPGGRSSLDWAPDGLIVELKIAASHTGQASTSEAVDQARVTRRRALVIEDEPLIAMELESNLSELGFLVVGRCVSTKAARRIWAEEAAIDLAVLDVNLGEETTYALAEEFRDAGVAVLFCTGYDMLDTPGALAGIPKLVKPVSKDSLAGAINVLLPGA
jgi:PAS domain S-box-containing protein